MVWDNNYYVLVNHNQMTIEKNRDFAGVYLASGEVNGEHIFAGGNSLVQALNKAFANYYWRHDMVKPKSLYEKLLGWSILSKE